MELVLASNFDDALVEATRELPVSTFFGNFPTSLVGGGRPPGILPAIDAERFSAHLGEVHRHGRKFLATINTAAPGLREYSAQFRARFDAEVQGLVELGVDGFVVAVPALIELIHRAYPDHPISVSTFARVRSISQAQYFRRAGATTIVLEEANRDFPLVRGLVREGMQVEVLVNQSCLPECPYRAHHLSTSSLASQTETRGPWFEYPILQCGLEYVRDPGRLIAGIFVRPEDLGVYEEAGVSRFKVSGRNRSTAWLVRAAEAYGRRSYAGDLTDILSLVQIRGPTRALDRLDTAGVEPATVAALRAAFRPLRRLQIENRAFPSGFLARIAATDCAHRSCADCGYCAAVARRVLRVDDRPLEQYTAPEGLPDPTVLLPWFAAEREPPHALAR